MEVMMSLTRLAVILTGVLFILIGVTTVTKTLELIFGIVIAALALLDGYGVPFARRATNA